AVIRLREHMHQDEINEGVNARQSFDASFPDADGEVASVRATLDDKARLSRQYEAVESLLEADITPAQICGLTPADIDIHTGDDRRSEDAFAAVYLESESFAVTVPARPLDRYLRKARTVEYITSENDTLFRTPEGEPVSVENFELVHRRGRLAQTNMTGQGGVCDALNESRRDKLNRDTPVAADAD
ncbi:metal-sulfur cluster biosynthetic enzyme, partial [Haloquadratum walsbyi]|uniref:metal-sulfur cluster biosynthetic enzyme n=1 Tax=Haloquadratum walsbyi TaxID=293091 RepID=UPI0015F4814C